MDIEELYKMIPNEATCRAFFEELIWPDGRVCPNFGCERSYRINGASTRSGLYECACCKRQFTVTTNTPMHSTKLPLFKWLLAIYYIINSSKGISSVYLARLIGVHHSTAWKMGHAIRKMMRMWGEKVIQLSGTIEIDEKYFDGKPRLQFGISRKQGTHNKRSILITVANGKKKTIWTPKPVLEQLKTLIAFSLGLKLHRSRKGGIVDINRSAFQLI